MQVPYHYHPHFFFLVTSLVHATPLTLHAQDAIEKYGLNEDGIYRKSGSRAQIKILQKRFDARFDAALTQDDCTDIHEISCLLKEFLRQLPDPLLTHELCDELCDLAAAGYDSPSYLGRTEVNRDIRALIEKMPPAHRETAGVLFKHLVKVCNREDANKMTPSNIAKLFGPTLMISGSSADEFSDVGRCVVVVKYLIEFFHEGFFSLQHEQMRPGGTTISSPAEDVGVLRSPSTVVEPDNASMFISDDGVTTRTDLIRYDGVPVRPEDVGQLVTVDGHYQPGILKHFARKGRNHAGKEVKGCVIARKRWDPLFVENMSRVKLTRDTDIFSGCEVHIHGLHGNKWSEKYLVVSGDGIATLYAKEVDAKEESAGGGSSRKTTWDIKNNCTHVTVERIQDWPHSSTHSDGNTRLQIQIMRNGHNDRFSLSTNSKRDCRYESSVCLTASFVDEGINNKSVVTRH